MFFHIVFLAGWLGKSGRGRGEQLDPQLLLEKQHNLMFRVIISRDFIATICSLM